MKARIHSVLTIDSDSLENVQPAGPADVSQWVRVMAGPTDSSREESFDLHVCTPRWIAREVETNGTLIGRRLMIIRAWSVELVRDTTGNRFTTADGDSWPELAERLGRVDYREFEDYRA